MYVCKREMYSERVLAQHDVLKLHSKGLFGFLLICILCIGYLVREYMYVCKREMYSERVLAQHDVLMLHSKEIGRASCRERV